MWNFQPHHCQKDHYLNDHFSSLWEELWKEKLNCWLAVFFKNVFHPRLKFSFTSWNFCDFKDAQQHVFFFGLPEPCFKLLYLHYKREPIKALRCIFIAHHPFSMPTHLPYTGVWAWLQFCLQIIGEVGNMTISWLSWLTWQAKDASSYSMDSFFGLKC